MRIVQVNEGNCQFGSIYYNRGSFSGSNSLPVDSKLNRNDELFAVAMARGMFRIPPTKLFWNSNWKFRISLTAFDTVPGSVPVGMTVVNPTTNTEVRNKHTNISAVRSMTPSNVCPFFQVIPMQETLEVRLKESTYQVVSDWPFAVNVKTENTGQDNMESSDSYSDCKPMQTNTKQSTQHPIYSTASQASQKYSIFELSFTVSLTSRFVSDGLSNWICLANRRIRSESVSNNQFAQR